MHPTKLQGIIPPMITPLKGDDELDREGAVRLTEHLVAGGAHAIFLLGTTGEAQSLTYRLRYEFVELVCRQVAGRVPVLVGVTDTAFIESIRLAEHAAKCGAVGVVARYMHLKRPETSADALAVDLSAAWSHPLENVGSYSTLRAGAKLGNLGGYLRDTEYTLPMDFTVGAALDTFLTDAHEITVGTDLGYYFSPSAVRGFQMSLGVEYNLMQLIQLRAGYHYGERRDYYPSYGSVGAGVRFLHLRLDFAYLIAKKQTLLHNTYSISFGLDF